MNKERKIPEVRVFLTGIEIKFTEISSFFLSGRCPKMPESVKCTGNREIEQILDLGKVLKN